ncbi:MAG: oligopeptide transporter, OPT family [Alphaproteobacteria bacterium]|nr:oligopeptide transporter, OPT family [Alphaproteobacteria bacterium]MBL6940145.1 oligopeptide transporter, OPT family [Alphaproteobacteria bacterium]MBL7100232.1 oligopeptide transporter, OPT family [Alphaproteobacteria bacterium]
MTEPLSRGVAELTFRGLFLGVLITFVFTAANVYLGLKVGLTFASSIPAAVISMAALSVFRGSSILENNIVQTVASAAGTLSSIIFVLPGLVIVGWWTGFPFWTSFLVCVAGGVLGVLFTIPLRRALVTHSDLPYPEGVAAAEVLKVGAGQRDDGTEADPSEAREGLLAVVAGSIASLAMVAVAATQVAVGEFQRFFHTSKNGGTTFDFSFSLALMGAGHLVGLSVGLAGLLGIIIGWGVAVPWLTQAMPNQSQALDVHVIDIWKNQVRFIGAGAIAVAAIWTLIKLARPVVSGLVSTLASARAKIGVSDDRKDRDLSSGWVVGLTVACLVLAAVVLWKFAIGAGLGRQAIVLTVASLPFVLVVGFLIAAVCGYMAGLIGSSNSPISSVGILTIVSCSALVLVVAAGPTAPLVAFALIVTAVVFAVATISNDNLQDLKTGQLVGAAPWRQQVALLIGVVAGAAVIPLVLNLLGQAYGFAGAPHATAKALAAPQATLISALAQGVIGHSLNWKMIGIGVLAGIGMVVLDEMLGAMKRLRLPPLAIAIGIYLPMSATLPLTIGAIVGSWYNRRAKRARNPQRAERLGTLVASGMIVGESLFGVVLSGLIVATSKDAPLAIVPADFAWANPIAIVLFVTLVAGLYGWMLRRNAATT